MTDFYKPILLAGLIASTLLVLPASAQQMDGLAESIRVRDVRNLKGVGVIVEEIEATDWIPSTLMASSLEAEIRSRLQERGVNTFTEEETIDDSDGAYLHLHLNMTRFNGGVIYHFCLDLNRDLYALIETEPGQAIEMFGSTTWERETPFSAVEEGAMGKIREDIMSEVDLFARDYKVANE